VDLRKHEPATVREIALADVLLDNRQAEPPCWQREDASLRNQPNLYGLQSSDGAVAMRHNGSDAQLSFVSANGAEALYGLLEGAAQYCGIARLVLFNEPDDSRVSSWARDARWAMPFAQYEMMKPI